MGDLEVCLLVVCVAVSYAVGIYTGHLLSKIDKEE